MSAKAQHRGERSRGADRAELVPLSIGALLNSPEQPIEWDVEELIPRASCVLVSGSPKTGKTWLMLELALSLAAGGRVFGQFSVPEPRRVLLILNEDGGRSVRDRLRGLMRGKGIEEQELGDRIGVLARKGFSLESPEHLEQLEKLVTGEGYEIVVLDPFTEMFSGNENDQQQVKSALQPLKRLRDRTGATILVSHHQRKPSEGDRARQAMSVRGSSYFVGWYDVGMSFRNASPGQPVRVEVEARDFEPRPPRFTLARRHAEDGGVRIELSSGASATQSELEAEKRVMAYVKSYPGSSTRAVEKESGGRESDNRAARQRLLDVGKLRVESGSGGACWWSRHIRHFGSLKI